MFIHACGARSRLFRPGKMQQVAFLPSGRERMEGLGQFGLAVHPLLKFLRYSKLLDAFHRHFGTRLLNGNGCAEIGVQ